MPVPTAVRPPPVSSAFITLANFSEFYMNRSSESPKPKSCKTFLPLIQLLKSPDKTLGLNLWAKTSQGED